MGRTGDGNFEEEARTTKAFLAQDRSTLDASLCLVYIKKIKQLLIYPQISSVERKLMKYRNSSRPFLMPPPAHKKKEPQSTLWMILRKMTMVSDTTFVKCLQRLFPLVIKTASQTYCVFDMQRFNPNSLNHQVIHPVWQEASIGCKVGVSEPFITGCTKR